MRHHTRYTFLLSITIVILAIISASCGNKNDPKKTYYNIFADSTSSKNTPPPLESQSPSILPTTTPTPVEIPPIDSKAPDGTLSFSSTAGFYNKALTIGIACKGNLTIRYTLDGDVPTATNSKSYVDPISMRIVGTTSEIAYVLRAAAFDGDKMVGSVITNTYIISGRIGTRYTTPVISITTDSSNLHDSKTGIASPENLFKRGMEWERPCHIEFFESDGKLGFSQDAGIRLFGGTSRGLPQKSYKIFARKEYSVSGNFKYELFPGHTERTDSTKIIDEYDSFILRNGANDSLNHAQPERATVIRDGFCHRLASMTGLDFMDYRSSVVYLNGDYYGLLNIREDLSNEYIAKHYDLPDDKITVMGSDVITSVKPYKFFYTFDTGDKSMEADFKAMIDFIITNDMSDEANYKQAISRLDIDTFIKYVAFEMYVCNTDWPQNNARAWKYTGPLDTNKIGADGKWRYMLKDLDFAFARYTIDKSNELYTRHDRDPFLHCFKNYYQDPLKIGTMLKSFLKNDTFRIQFVNYMCDVINDVVSPTRAKYLLDVGIREVQTEMPINIQRWSAGAQTTEAWLTRFDTIRNFIDLRPAAVIGFMKITNELGVRVSSTLNIVKTGNGVVKINTVVVTDNNWKGTYFRGIPVTITAIPDPGYSFTGFTTVGSLTLDKVNETQSTLNVNGTGTINANFTK